MFGAGSLKSAKDVQREQEIEQKKSSVRQFLQAMHDVSPEEAASCSEKLKLFFQSDKLLPFDYRQKAQKRARDLECAANQRAADKLAREAIVLIARADMPERGKKIAESRKYFGKACTLGVGEEWRKAYQRLVETIMLSGGLKHDEPSRAKPLDIAPKAPNRAKS